MMVACREKEAMKVGEEVARLRAERDAALAKLKTTRSLFVSAE